MRLMKKRRSSTTRKENEVVEVVGEEQTLIK